MEDVSLKPLILNSVNSQKFFEVGPTSKSFSSWFWEISTEYLMWDGFFELSHTHVWRSVTSTHGVTNYLEVLSFTLQGIKNKRRQLSRMGILKYHYQLMNPTKPLWWFQVIPLGCVILQNTFLGVHLLTVE